MVPTIDVKLLPVISEELKSFARKKDGLLWFLWKTEGIPRLMEFAMTLYSNYEKHMSEMDKWTRLGELTIQSIYSSPGPESCLGDCPICTEPLHRKITTSCGHNFHGECLELWIKENLSCPLCRKNLCGKFVTTVRKSPLLIYVEEPGDNAIIVTDWIKYFITDLQLYRLEVQKSPLIGTQKDCQPQKRLSTEETRQDSNRNPDAGPSTTTPESDAGPSTISESDVAPSSSSTISESEVGPTTTPESDVGPSTTHEFDVGPSTIPESDVGSSTTHESDVEPSSSSTTPESDVGPSTPHEVPPPPMIQFFSNWNISNLEI
ncbi:putative RING finger protein C548.05c like protein [Argiope bruennichi]|uniref:Putative RING finger protein C548.05c like protein n=1 Tax=Argiope bruennichi TaxID=94029 RepID=A0A8T0FTQ1_ARGBR|nr:putative RING finger protein C548.05c like protein [Argiope bruennichi]